MADVVGFGPSTPTGLPREVPPGSAKATLLDLSTSSGKVSFQPTCTLGALFEKWKVKWKLKWKWKCTLSGNWEAVVTPIVSPACILTVTSECQLLRIVHSCPTYSGENTQDERACY